MSSILGILIGLIFAGLLVRLCLWVNRGNKIIETKRKTTLEGSIIALVNNSEKERQAQGKGEMFLGIGSMSYSSEERVSRKYLFYGQYPDDDICFFEWDVSTTILRFSEKPVFKITKKFHKHQDGEWSEDCFSTQRIIEIPKESFNQYIMVDIKKY